MIGNELQKLGALIEIIGNGGGRVATSTVEPKGTAGQVSFGVDVGGAFVSVSGGDRMNLDDAITLVADLTNAICEAKRMEWSREHGLRRYNQTLD